MGIVGPHEQIDTPYCPVHRCSRDGSGHPAERLLLGNVSTRIHRSRRGTRANSDRIYPGTGLDRAWHTVNGGDGQRGGFLLHFAARRAAYWLHAATGERSTGHSRLFRQKSASGTPCQLWPEGRESVRLRQPCHANWRQGRRLSQRAVQDLLHPNSWFAGRRRTRRRKSWLHPNSSRNRLVAGSANKRQCQCASTASSKSATILVILIIGLTAGPAVSLYGSPTVSPVTAALCGSEPFPP